MLGKTVTQHGYFSGIKQIARHFELRIPAPAGLDCSRLDQWLQTTFNLQVPAEPESAVRAGGEAELVARFAWRGLHLAAALLRAGRVPVYDPGCIERVTRVPDDAGQWRVGLLIAHVDHLTMVAYPQVLRIVGQLLTQWAAGTSLDNREDLLHELDSQLIQPMRGLAGGGQSAIHILKAAYERDLPFSHLGQGNYQLGRGCHGLLLHRSSVFSDSAVGVNASSDKVLSATWLRGAGIPTTTHWLAHTEQHALEIAQDIGWPIVVKPADRGRGEGVAVNVKDAVALGKAYREARKHSERVLVEGEVRGRCHRIVVCNGRMLYAVERLPQSVVGDGKRTVRELINAANQSERLKPIWERSKARPDDMLALRQLQSSGMTFESVPFSGQRAFLRPFESGQWGGDVADCTDTIHPENVDVAERAARLFGLAVAGVDLITPDVTRPWYDVDAVINEVNAAPLLGAYTLSRSRLGEMLDRLIPGSGRIPVEVMIGGDAAMIAARKRQQVYVGQQTECYVTSHEETFSPTGTRLGMAISGLVARCNALLMDRRVAAIILVIQTDEILDTGVPVDRIDGLEILPGMLTAVADAGAELDEGLRSDSVLTTLKHFLADATPASQPKA